ncbi:DGQHR domain-containing protein [Brucella anthropi]|uniref:DGQHR domain-containing protein n=1 Tax=Brucella anthropi TaxID=529 RepID=UPI00384B0E0E
MTEPDRISFSSVSLVRQGDHRFYSLTLPTEFLADTTFVIAREEDPFKGFQRELDEKRAREIAAYIDSGLGTIPSAIILSAQPDAELEYDRLRKSLSFRPIRKAFLIIDGQHRVYGFMLAEKAFRVPVIIYAGLSRRDETRLFIDINSKQKGVRAELLLDIKKLAEYERDEEALLREIFDTFMQESSSALYNKLSPSSKAPGKISRSVFNTALKPLVRVFGEKSQDELYQILNAYFVALVEGVLRRHQQDNLLFNAIFFRAACAFFLIVAPKVKDRFGAIYTVDNFYYFLEQVGGSVKTSRLKGTGSAYKPIVESLEDALKGTFQL